MTLDRPPSNMLAEVFAWGLPFLLSVFAGVVRVLQQGSCSLKAWVSGLAAATLTGLIVHLLLQGVEYDPKVETAIVAVASYAGGDLLKVLAERACSLAETISGKSGS